MERDWASARKALEKQRSSVDEESREALGLYIISVAARLLEMHPQTLRKYERVGLVAPSRTLGMLRLYSSEDIGRLRTIKYLVEKRRLNLAGVELAIALASRLLEMQEELTTAEREGQLLDRLKGSIAEMLEMLGID